MTRPRIPVWIQRNEPFPDPACAGPEGLLAIGADLSPERLLDAYRRGIFPWPMEQYSEPMLWWSPDPRFVLYPDELRVSRSLEQRIRSGRFEIAFDTAFREVMEGCATASRPDEEGTWITPGMVRAYVRLHELGFAHSVESRLDGELVGGLYGVALGGAFFGESMFARVADASKVAFVHLVRRLRGRDFALIDCQQETDHLARFGARGIPRTIFLEQVAEAVARPNRPGPWRLERVS